MKQDDDLVNISVRVTKETAASFKKIADASYRPVAAELRRMIQERVDLEQEAA